MFRRTKYFCKNEKQESVVIQIRIQYCVQLLKNQTAKKIKLEGRSDEEEQKGSNHAEKYCEEIWEKECMKGRSIGENDQINFGFVYFAYAFLQWNHGCLMINDSTKSAMIVETDRIRRYWPKLHRSGAVISTWDVIIQSMNTRVLRKHRYYTLKPKVDRTKELKYLRISHPVNSVAWSKNFPYCKAKLVTHFWKLFSPWYMSVYVLPPQSNRMPYPSVNVDLDWSWNIFHNTFIYFTTKPSITDNHCGK